MRVAEQERFVQEFPAKHKISFVEGSYDTEKFYAMAKGMENLKEGGERCFACYELRLREAAEYAKEKGFDFFTTTLSISPLKNAQKLNEIGAKLEEEYGVNYLYSDFKKQNGYKRSTEISNEYEMYRQYYCGCVYLYRGRTLGIVGESGSGKSVTSRAILGILAGNRIIDGGQILYDGKDLLKLSEESFTKIRGSKIAMIFQDPMSSLNPLMKVGKQLTEAMVLKGKASRKEAKKKIKLIHDVLVKHAKNNNYLNSKTIDGLFKRWTESTYPLTSRRARDIKEA